MPPEGVAYAGHADGVKSVLSVAENLEFWAEVHGTSGIDVALAAFDLVALKRRRAGDLSAGQRRRLGLARLLVTGRRLWVLDEPYVALDAAAIELVAGLIGAHLQRGGLTVLTTHQPVDVAAGAVRELRLD